VCAVLASMAVVSGINSSWNATRTASSSLDRESNTPGLISSNSVPRADKSRSTLLRTTPAELVPKPAAAHKIYPYLLRGLAIERVNQVWCSNVTYIPRAKGFLYPVVIMDWVSRAVLAWRVSNTLGADFCVEALEEALSRYGRPEIFNKPFASSPG
jgi:transposase InsO family protein